MGQISPLDPLISNSAFNDCSVTVIYSGVIIPDVLLLCAGCRPPLPHCSVPMWSCFLGLLQPLLLWCFAFLLFQVPLNARSPRWPDSASVKKDDRIHPLDQSQRSLFEPCKHLPSTSLMCIHVWMWVSMCPARWCVQYMYAYENVCTDFLTSSVCFTLLWYKLLTAFAWNFKPLWLSTLYFPSPLSQETRIQLHCSLIFSFLVFTHKPHLILAAHRNDRSVLWPALCSLLYKTQ